MKKTIDAITGLLFFASIGMLLALIWVPEIYMLKIFVSVFLLMWLSAIYSRIYDDVHR